MPICPYQRLEDLEVAQDQFSYRLTALPSGP